MLEYKDGLPMLSKEERCLALEHGREGVIRAVKDKVRARCKKGSLRLKAFFEPFDHHHTKRIGRAEFVRALDQAGLVMPALAKGPSEQLSPYEVALLLARYGVEPDEVDYGRFV
ncbi:unnamed protein product, partial [Chrysoparadoxa australica]